MFLFHYPEESGDKKDGAEQHSMPLQEAAASSEDEACPGNDQETGRRLTIDEFETLYEQYLDEGVERWLGCGGCQEE